MMTSIEDIIFAEFKNYSYEIISNHGAIVVFKHKEYIDFWVVCTEKFELSRQHDIYESTVMSIVENFQYAPKNTSLLVLSDLAKEQLSSDEIVELEKDPFFFKKYVLPYNEELSKKLQDLLLHKNANSISELIMLPESFNALIEEKDYGLYHLLYCLAHKLPFVPIKAEQKGLQQRDFCLSNCDEKTALEEVMSINGDLQDIYDQLKLKVEQECNDQYED